MHRVALHSATALGSFRTGLGSRYVPVPNHRYGLKVAARAVSNIPNLPGLSGKKRENTRYGDEDYWDQRYNEEAFLTFDWYQCYIDLAPILKKHVPQTAKVLMAGCGNAVMSEDMVKDGYQNIVNVDYSKVLIHALKFKYKHMPQLTYKAMDVRNMAEFPADSFDAAIDKGLVDAMVCAPDGSNDVTQMLREMYRILKPGGNFILVTYGFPLTRVPALMEKGMNWITNCWVFPRPYSGRELSKYPDPLSMNEVKNWINTKKEDYEIGANFVYVATKR